MTPAELAHLRRARDLMDREYARPLDVPAMARVAHASPSRFRELVGMTPREYRATVRDVPGVPPCAVRMLTRSRRNREAGTVAAN